MKMHANGTVVVLESTLKMSDLKMVHKYRPEKLSVKGGKDGEQVLFSVVATDNGNGALSEKAAFFAPALNGKASITITDIPAAAKVNEEALKGYIADMVGSAKGYIEQLEESIPAVVDEIKAERTALMNAIDMGDAVATESAAE